MADELPKRWPLVTNPGNRYNAPTQDGRLVNCYAEKDSQFNEYDVYRRPGLRPSPSLETFTDNGKGISNWSPSFGTQYLMQVRENSGTAALYKNTTSIGTVQNAVYDAFEPVNSSPATLFFKAGGYGYTTDGTSVTAISDGVWTGFAANVLPGAASLNGRLYVLVAPNLVYGAKNRNDGTQWDALNLILANDNPDWGTYISRYLQYILVFKAFTTEVFQDEGNPTGSPLGKVPGVSIPYGCQHPETVVWINDDLLWVGVSKSKTSNTNLRQVVHMSGLVPQVISTPKVDRLLSTYTPVRAFNLLLGGHKFYCIEMYTGLEYFHIVYDLTEGLWSEWHFPTQIRGASGGPYGLILQAVTGKPLQIISGADKDVIDEVALPISMDIYTPNMDFGVDYVKTLWNLYFTGDQTKGTRLKIRRSDDDYQTWSNFRTVDLGLKKPQLSNEGSFYRRAYHLRFDQAGPIRLRSIGLSLDLGVM